jgi:hypothetical protein
MLESFISETVQWILIRILGSKFLSQPSFKLVPVGWICPCIWAPRCSDVQRNVDRNARNLCLGIRLRWVFGFYSYWARAPGAVLYTVWDPLSGKLGTKGFPDLESFWIFGPWAQKICKFNNYKHTLTFALLKKCLKLNSESQNYRFCQQNSLWFF